jgi:peptide deformylase
MALFPIRTFGDPGLKRACPDVADAEWGTKSLRRLAADMIDTMYDAPGVGLAANQIGVQKRLFVYDCDDGNGAQVVLNPRIAETDGEYEHDEGCLSVPGLFFPVTRAGRVRMTGWDLDGNEIDRWGEGLEGRIFLHETDHLDGHLLLDRLDPEIRRHALKILRHRAMGLPPPEVPDGILLDRGEARRSPQA